MLLVLFASPRNSDSTAAGLRFVGAISKEKKVGVLLMQDAVLLGLKAAKSPESAFGGIVEGCALEEHLVKRGFGPESLDYPFKPVNHDGAVEMLMRDGVSVVGCF